MPNWTPNVSDKVVYTTVDSGSIQEVGKFLSKLKQDLCIGQEGYPSYVIVGGDQQTYSPTVPISEGQSRFLVLKFLMSLFFFSKNKACPDFYDFWCATFCP